MNLSALHWNPLLLATRPAPTDGDAKHNLPPVFAVINCYRIPKADMQSPPPAAPDIRTFIETGLSKSYPEWLKGMGELGSVVQIAPGEGVYVAQFARHESNRDDDEGAVAALVVSPEVADAIINSGVLHEADNLCFGCMHGGVLDEIVIYMEI